MKNPGLNSLVLILIIVTLVILSSITLINEIEEEKVEAVKEITGKMKTFEVSSGDFNKHYPTKKNTKRYNDKLFEYLEHIQSSRDNTFHKGKVFLREK